MTFRTAPNHLDVLEDLQYQHETILETFEEFKAAEDEARVKPFAQLKARIRQHSDAEESDFYPMVAALGTAEATLIDTAETEHIAIEAALDAIEGVGAENATGGQVTTLENTLKGHITSERNNIFSVARKGLTANQRKLSASQVAEKFSNLT
jgi:hemerythrin-like domain-containing protein